MSESVSVKVGLDASTFNSEAQRMAQSLKTVQSEFKASDAALAASGTKIEQLENKYKSLQTQLKMQSDITKKYESALKSSGSAEDAARAKLEKSRQAYEAGKKQYSANSKELQKLEKEVTKNEKALNRAATTHEKYKGKLVNSQAAEDKLRRSINTTNTELEKQQSFIGRVNTKFSELNNKTAGIQKGLTSTGRALTIGVTAPLILAGKKITDTTKELNKSLANVGTLNVSSDRLAEIKKGVQDVAIDVAKSTTDISDGTYQVISAYGDTADTIEMVRINAKAAASGLATTTDAINLTSAVTKGYGEVSAAATQKVSDLAFETVRLGQTTFPELASSMGSVVPSSNALKVSQEELFTVFATLTGVTGTASEVSTQLASVYTALMKPSKNMTAALEKMGYKSGFAAVKSLGLQGTLSGLVKATGGSEEALVKLAGRKEAVTAMLALTGAQADTFTKKLEEMKNASGATDRAFAAQTEGINKTGFTFEQAMIKMQVAAQNFGESAAPFIAKGADAISGLADWLGSLDDEKRDNVLKLGLGLAALGPACTIASKGITVVNGAISVTSALSAAGTLGSIGAFAGVLGAIGVAGFAAYKGMEAYHKAQLDTVKATSEQIQATRDSLSEYQKISAWAAEAKRLDTIIKTSTDTAEVDEAKRKLDELKKQVEEKYEATVRVNDGDVVKALDRLSERSYSEFKAERAELQTRINGSNFEKSVGNVAKFEKELFDAQKSADDYATAMALVNAQMKEYNAEKSTLEKQRDSGTISGNTYQTRLERLKNEYVNKINKIYEDIGVYNREKNIFAGISPHTQDIDAHIGYLSARIEYAQSNIGRLSPELDKANAEIDQYREAMKGVADVTSALVPQQLANGEFEQAVSSISTALMDLKGYTDVLGFDKFAEEITEQLSLAQQGFNDFSQLAASGDEGMANYFRDYVTNATKAGASISEAFAASAVKLGLLKSGFKDLNEAAAADGGLKTLSDNITALAKTIDGFPQDTKINISANGNLSFIDEATEKVKEIQTTCDVNVQITADGNIQVLNEATGEAYNLKEFSENGVHIQVDADGNIDILNEAEQKIGHIDGTTGKYTLEADVTAAEEKIEETEENHSEMDVLLNVDTDPIDKAIEKYDGKRITLVADLAFGGTADVSLPRRGAKRNAQGTRDFSGGLAMINDQKGVSDPRELVEVDGKGYIFEGRDVVVPLPKHAKVYTSAQTKEIMTGAGIPHYASGKNTSAFDTAKKAFQHRQKVSEVSTADALKWWQEIRATMALAEEEAWEVEENIYSLTKELNKKSISDYKERISDQISDGERWLNFQVKINHMSYDDQIATLQRIDDKHLATLDEMVRNTQMTEEEKDEIMQEYYKKHEDRIIDIAELEKKKAQEVYETKMKLSEDYFSERSFYNDWTELGDDPIEAYNRVKNRINGELTDETDPDVIKSKLEDLKNFGETIYDERREDSKKWVEAEEYYGNLTTQGKIDAIKRQQKYTKEYYAAGIISHRKYCEELSELDKEYFSEVKNLLDEAVDDYYDARKEELDIKRQAIEDEYKLEKEKEDTADREAKLKKLRQQEAMFDGAVTIEGKKRLEEIQEEIASLEKERANEAREKEKSRRLEEIDSEAEALDKEHEAALKGTSKYAQQIAGVIGSSNEAAITEFNKLMSEYTRQQEEIAAKGAASIGSIVNWTNAKMRELDTMESRARSSAAAVSGGTVTGDTNYTLKQTNNFEIIDRTDAVIFANASLRSFKNVMK